MRALACGASLAWLAGCAGATHQASGRVHVYDDPRITVVSPTVSDRLAFERTSATATYTVDAVSGATQSLTVDAISTATRFSERRHQGSLAVSHAPASGVEASAGYTLSREPDHTVHAPSTGLTLDLLRDMARASVRYQLVIESTGRVDAPSFDSNALGHRLDLGWTQILSRSLVLTWLGTTTATRCDANIGCFANPYRYVGVLGQGGVLALGERHPDERFTVALSSRVAWALDASRALHVGYRVADDTWRIAAHTVDVSFVSEHFARRLLARVEVRATAHGAAAFYRSRYTSSAETIPEHRTADSELSRLYNARAHLQLEWAWGRTRLVTSGGRMWSRYPDFASLPARDAWIAGLGVDMEL